MDLSCPCNMLSEIVCSYEFIETFRIGVVYFIQVDIQVSKDNDIAGEFGDSREKARKFSEELHIYTFRAWTVNDNNE